MQTYFIEKVSYIYYLRKNNTIEAVPLNGM